MPIAQTHVILLAHGSRDSNWCKTFEFGCQQMRPHLKADASIAYMELASPSLEDVVKTQISKGVEVIEIHPLFLAAGKHLLIDIPKMVHKLEHEYPSVQFRIHEALGKNPGFWQFIGAAVNQSLEENDHAPLAQSA